MAHLVAEWGRIQEHEAGRDGEYLFGGIGGAADSESVA